MDKKEYIERAAVKDEILSWAVCINHPELLSKEDTMYCIDNMPAADVEEVVRCKDCIYYRNKQCESADFWNAFHGDDIGVHFIPDPDFYCACGERRKGNA